MKFPGLLLALCVGALLPLQALINARLAQLTHGPLFASLASFAVGGATLLACWLVLRPAHLQGSTLGATPWWAWTGGAIGAMFVLASTLLVPRLGAAALACLVVFGQLAGSLLLDHHGVLHARQPIDALRVLGMVLVAAGALLSCVRGRQRGPGQRSAPGTVCRRADTSGAAAGLPRAMG